jgi:hypothetical protein
MGIEEVLGEPFPLPDVDRLVEALARAHRRRGVFPGESGTTRPVRSTPWGLSVTG